MCNEPLTGPLLCSRQAELGESGFVRAPGGRVCVSPSTAAFRTVKHTMASFTLQETGSLLPFLIQAGLLTASCLLAPSEQRVTPLPQPEEHAALSRGQRAQGTGESCRPCSPSSPAGSRSQRPCVWSTKAPSLFWFSASKKKKKNQDISYTCN